MSNKAYILLKDLPDAKAGTEIIINDGATHYYIPVFAPRLTMYRFTEAQLISNPEWFLKKEEQQPKEYTVTWQSVRNMGDGVLFGFDTCVLNGKEFIDKKAVEEYLKSKGKEKDVFQWTDSIVKDGIEKAWITGILKQPITPAKFVDELKQSKSTPKGDKVEVFDLHKHSESDIETWYSFVVRHYIPPEKYEAVKKAIEFVLNDSPVFDKEKIDSRLKRIHYLQAVACDLISRIYHYGNFKAETINEKELEYILKELQLFPTTEDEILLRPNINYQTLNH